MIDMKVILLVSRYGPTVSQEAGQEIEVSAEEGARLIKAGQARPVEAKQRATRKPKTEKAVK